MQSRREWPRVAGESGCRRGRASNVRFDVTCVPPARLDARVGLSITAAVAVGAAAAARTVDQGVERRREKKDEGEDRRREDRQQRDSCLHSIRRALSIRFRMLLPCHCTFRRESELRNRVFCFCSFFLATTHTRSRRPQRASSVAADARKLCLHKNMSHACRACFDCVFSGFLSCLLLLPLVSQSVGQLHQQQSSPCIPVVVQAAMAT